MKNTKRLILGVISSLLLAAGFAQAAEKIDPIAANSSTQSSLRVAEDCDGPCGIANDLN